MVVIAVDEREAMGNRVQAGGLRADIAISRHVSPVNDLGEAIKRRILERVFDDDRLEAAAAVHVA